MPPEETAHKIELQVDMKKFDSEGNLSENNESNRSSGNISSDPDSCDDFDSDLKSPKKISVFPLCEAMLSKYADITATGYSGLSPKKSDNLN